MTTVKKKVKENLVMLVSGIPTVKGHTTHQLLTPGYSATWQRVTDCTDLDIRAVGLPAIPINYEGRQSDDY